MDPQRNFTNLKKAAFLAWLSFQVECNAVDDDKCNTALWVAEYVRIQGVGSLGPVFNVELSRWKRRI